MSMTPGVLSRDYGRWFKFSADFKSRVKLTDRRRGLKESLKTSRRDSRLSPKTCFPSSTSEHKDRAHTGTENTVAFSWSPKQQPSPLKPFQRPAVSNRKLIHRSVTRRGSTHIRLLQIKVGNRFKMCHMLENMERKRLHKYSFMCIVHEERENECYSRLCASFTVSIGLCGKHMTDNLLRETNKRFSQCVRPNAKTKRREYDWIWLP